MQSDTASYKILADEPEFLVVSKMHNVSMHSEKETTGDGLIQCLRKDLSREDLLPVHRLDKATSGLLLIGKGSSNTRELSLLFQEKRILKFYWALSQGKPRKKQGKIVGDLIKTRGGSYKLTQTRSNPSVTQFLSYSLGDGLRAFLLHPHTGKTHQLRVIMKSLGVPILGDYRYGSASQADINTQGSPLQLCLHACALRFTAFNKQYQFEEAPDFKLPCEQVFKSVIGTIESVFTAPFPKLKDNQFSK